MQSGARVELHVGLEWQKVNPVFVEFPHAPRPHKAATFVVMRADIDDPCARHSGLCEMHRRYPSISRNATRSAICPCDKQRLNDARPGLGQFDVCGGRGAKGRQKHVSEAVTSIYRAQSAAASVPLTGIPPFVKILTLLGCAGSAVVQEVGNF